MGSNKKAQAALEFLMTYGWAILVVLIVIAALGYFNVLNPTMLLPEKCTLPPGFKCEDHIFNLYTGSAVLKLNNARGQDAEITGIQIGNPGDANYCSIDTGSFPLSQVQTNGDLGVLLSNGESTEISVPCQSMVSSTGKQKTLFKVTWRQPGGESHTIDGDMVFRANTDPWPTADMCNTVSGAGLCADYQTIFPSSGNFKGFGCECMLHNAPSCSGYTHPPDC